MSDGAGLPRRRRPYPWWTPFPFAVGWSLLGLPFAFFVSAYSHTGPLPSTTLVGVNGDGVLVPIALPAVLALAAWVGAGAWRTRPTPWRRRLAWSPVAGLAVMAILGVLSLVVSFLAAPAAALCALGVSRSTVGAPGRARGRVVYGAQGPTPPTRSG
ncbi:MAG: hypothetical protein ACRDV0_07040 [Acidimicrobiales bacterium]